MLPYLEAGPSSIEFTIKYNKDRPTAMQKHSFISDTLCIIIAPSEYAHIKFTEWPPGGTIYVD
jgi:hypothetical protein